MKLSYTLGEGEQRSVINFVAMRDFWDQEDKVRAKNLFKKKRKKKKEKKS